MICSCCYSYKDESEFPVTPTGFRSYCKSCYSYIRWWNRQKPESKAVHNAASRRWVEANKGRRSEINAECRAKRKDADRELRKKWREQNRGRVNAHTAARRARKRKATPAWADKTEIEYIYSLAQEQGLVVDHIVPLKHPLVCGLHVQDNLRCITAELNARKGNFYFPDSLPVYWWTQEEG